LPLEGLPVLVVPYYRTIFSSHFLIDSVPLTWADVFWAYKYGLMGWRVPIEIAEYKVKSGLSVSPLELDLMAVGKDDDWRVDEILEQLAELDPSAEDEIVQKWMYLTFLQMYNKRLEPTKVLYNIDLIHAGFNYPEELNHLATYYFSGEDNDRRNLSPDESITTILRQFKEYLDARHEFYFGGKKTNDGVQK
jgi:hypothetical protein